MVPIHAAFTHYTAIVLVLLVLLVVVVLLVVHSSLYNTDSSITCFFEPSGFILHIRGGLTNPVETYKFYLQNADFIPKSVCLSDAVLACILRTQYLIYLKLISLSVMWTPLLRGFPSYRIIEREMIALVGITLFQDPTEIVVSDF